MNGELIDSACIFSLSLVCVFYCLSSYLFIIGMIVTGIFWDKQINVGLRKFDALVIVPVMQVTCPSLLSRAPSLFFGQRS